ncbi:hypothetical protein BLNAU_16406 [Blattamonas nauphoetae]|uniref:Uncharacterized protein n=1 Tax=Blattamonas nauphoetae TaxID=2049346 RepID=A0ABQ9XBF4_9EUKA|nr:hypothetical protein BLNAU_16406 [Blattamonas nauphoetae]
MRVLKPIGHGFDLSFQEKASILLRVWPYVPNPCRRLMSILNSNFLPQSRVLPSTNYFPSRHQHALSNKHLIEGPIR